MGVNVNNATRWLVIGGDNGVQFQPSELSKLIVIICAATFLDKYKQRNRINTFKCLALFAILSALTLFLISQEPDLSTTICHTFILLTILYVSGLSYKIIGIALLAFVPLAGSFLWYIQQPGDKILIKQYQINRILPFIYPSKYGDDSSQQNNSIMAIGSGQLTGKGLNTSTIATVKDTNFISEQQTDFIFSVIGEELGFVGSVIIIAILLLIVLQCIRVARRAKDTKGMLIATGLGVQIGFQSFINIGVASGVLPNTGIPLPFISYGLSSLFSVAIGMGMVLNISQQEYRLMD
jgi:rod shape determining protein RodA